MPGAQHKQISCAMLLFYTSHFGMPTIATDHDSMSEAHKRSIAQHGTARTRY